MTLDVGRARGEMNVRWYDVDRGGWNAAESIDRAASVRLKAFVR